ncbi:MAG: FKBP-type peptidyl-prolyl cis-trans isomerase [Planctomycetia bacterium]
MRRRRALPRRSTHTLLRWETLGHSVTGLEALEARQVLAADLAVELAPPAFYAPATQGSYTVIVKNLGTTAVTGASLTTALASQFRDPVWTAAYSTGASGPVSGAGQIATGDVLSIPQGGSATFSIIGTFAADAEGVASSTATVAATGDTTPANDSVTRTQVLVPKSILVTDAAGWTSSSIVRVVDPATGSVRTQFDAFPGGYRGGVQAVLGDLDGNGLSEIIVTPGKGIAGVVKVFTLGGVELTSYQITPFGPQWTGGVNLAVGDVDGDRLADIVVSRATGDGEVRVFRTAAAATPGQFATIRPFAANFVGGSSVAVGDFGTFANGTTVDAAKADGRLEIVVGRGPTAAPLVQVYDVSGATPAIVKTIAPFEAGFLGGVTVSTARINTDSIADIIVASGRRGGSRIEIHDGRVGTNATLQTAAAFAALDSRNAAVAAAAIDTDGDGRADSLFATQGAGGTAGLRRAAIGSSVFSALGGTTGATAVTAASEPVNTDVVTTASGLRYRDLVVGAGARPSSNTARVTVNYVGRLLNGTQFDGRDNQQFNLNGVIAGWTEGLGSMRVGGRRQLIVPANLGYGSSGTGTIPPNATLVFDVELLATT